jgi:hypothetical protein
MPRPGSVPGLRIGLVRRMAVAGVNMDEAKTNLPVAAGCRLPARTFLPLSASALAPYTRALLANCSIVNVYISPRDQPIHRFPANSLLDALAGEIFSLLRSQLD